MSTTSSVAAGSRPCSPFTPLTPESSDCLEPVSIQSEPDMKSPWYLSTTYSTKSTLPAWASDSSLYNTPHKTEEEQMLRLDDLIEQNAYEDSPPSEIRQTPITTTITTGNQFEPVIVDFGPRNLLSSSHHSRSSITKPIPPPVTLPRKLELSSINNKVVCPPKDVCINLPILFPSIPQGGTKSRVETQVRITVDLAQSSDPFKYDRVGSWKWLKLPHGTTTKRRPRKQGKIDPEPEDILHLETAVTCSTPPHNPVLSCSSCQAREAKRMAKKLAARVRPARSDSDSDSIGNGKSKSQEDTTSIIQFNCAEILDFSTGSVVLPLRITCYCRHHREKVGFNIHFTMMDHLGRIVGIGMTKPIMITDDHKTSAANKPPELSHNYPSSDLHEWTKAGSTLNEPNLGTDLRAPSRRKGEVEISTKSAKKRHKPYDSSSKPNRLLREGSTSSAPSPSTVHSPVPPTRASTPSLLLQNVAPQDPPLASHPPPLHYPVQGSETSSPDSLVTPLDHNSDVPMPSIAFDMPDRQLEHTQTTLLHSTVLPSDLSLVSIAPSLPFLFLDPNQGTQPLHVQMPIIHRLIPNSGPTFGGIEVTLLGANFHPTLQLSCVFGDVAATSTQRWSDNTLVCILPPRTTPGVVPVWFDGFPKADNSPLFTYNDESDRALMELALQVVGLKMTGKIEDAKNVAMRIVGNTSSDKSESNNNNVTTEMMQMSSPSIRDLRPLLLARASALDNFESRIISFLSILDTPMGGSAPNSLPTPNAISHSTSSGQTLLHLAVFLRFESLTRFLVEHDADLDVRDRNGFTPLHFAAFARSSVCASALIVAGADLEIVDSRGKTARELAPEFFDSIITRQNDEVESEDDPWYDEDANLGDAEEDADMELRRILNRRISQKTRRPQNQSGKGTPLWSASVSRATTPPPVSLPVSDEKMKKVDMDNKASSDSVDVKQAASFIEKMQRTLAQIPARPGINIPQFDFSAALPQIPMVFPVYVPMNWPSFRGGDHNSGTRSDSDGDEATRNVATAALRTAQDWRATWEKWVALVVATTARQQTEDVPPPVYTPRAEEQTQNTSRGDTELQEQLVARRSHSDTRPVGYDSAPVPDQVVESFAYQPNPKPGRRLRRKPDRMLLLFWLPIFLLSIVWAFHHGVPLVVQIWKTSLPAKATLRT